LSFYVVDQLDNKKNVTWQQLNTKLENNLNNLSSNCKLQNIIKIGKNDNYELELTREMSLPSLTGREELALPDFSAAGFVTAEWRRARRASGNP